MKSWREDSRGERGGKGKCNGGLHEKKRYIQRGIGWRYESTVKRAQEREEALNMRGSVKGNPLCLVSSQNTSKCFIKNKYPQFLAGVIEGFFVE